jgi:hypothetical protein
MINHRFARALAPSALAATLVGSIVTSAKAMPLPVTSVQDIAGAAATEQVQWWGGRGWGWRRSYYGGGALAAGLIGGLALGTLAASASSYYGYGYPSYYGYSYPSNYGYGYGYYPSSYAYPAYSYGYYPSSYTYPAYNYGYRSSAHRSYYSTYGSSYGWGYGNADWASGKRVRKHAPDVRRQ